MQNIIVEEYDLTKRTRPLKLKKVTEFQIETMPLDIPSTLIKELAARGYDNYRFWSMSGMSIVAVIGDEKALNELDFDATEAERNA